MYSAACEELSVDPVQRSRTPGSRKWWCVMFHWWCYYGKWIIASCHCFALFTPACAI